MVTASESRFWSAAARAASAVPAVGAERQSWITRNLTEFALMLEIADAPAELLDKLVQDHDLSLANRRHTDRLRRLRERRGAVPVWYPQGSIGDDTAHDDAVQTVRPEVVSAARAILAFAEQLEAALPGGPGPELEVTGGHGEAAVVARADWRPLPAPATPHTFVDVDIPPDLIWRAWMVLPDRGITRVVTGQHLTQTDMDVWMGVHDGIHLDHVACFDTTTTTPIEFGSGLLVTEALAMSGELLAGAEALAAGDLTTQVTVRAELIERVGRLLPELTEPGPCADLVARLNVTADREFPALPTVARAYVVGPIRMIAGGFTDPLIPDSVSTLFRDRWARAELAHPAVRSIGDDARAWYQEFATV
ncbi:MAG: hypothetical protein V4531_07300 [Actinomycetota bacterium]